MPTYDYQCGACDHVFEEFQSITSKPLRKCPACGKQKLNRLIGTGAGVIFKGSGFYQTDYRSEGYQKSAKAESDAAKPKTDDKKPGESKPAEAAASTDTKPAATKKKAADSTK